MTQNVAAVKFQINETNDDLGGKIEALNTRVDQVETVFHPMSKSDEEEDEGINELINEAQGTDSLNVLTEVTKDGDEEGSELLQQFIEQTEAEEQMDTNVDPRVATITNKVLCKIIEKRGIQKINNQNRNFSSQEL